MIKILSTSVPDNQPLTNRETEAAHSIIDFINKCFISLGLGVGSADLQVVKHPKRGYPQFCPQSLNSKLPCDLIFLSMDSFTFWCQLIFQASHEFTHCVIYRLSSQKEQGVSWVEETICEAMSLVFLNTFFNNWNRCGLSSKGPSYGVCIQKYLSDRLQETGNHRLEQCHGIGELQKINRTSESRREDRRKEMHQLYRLIQSVDDIRGLVHYRDFVVPGTILLDTQRYQKAYPSSQAVQYLCRLQKNALRRDVAVSKVPEKS